MFVVKAFNKDLSCRGYRFKKGINITGEANCRSNGFHAAENPLDCLSYYKMSEAVFWLCLAGGDIDEDDVDSKVSCTKLTLLRELDLFDFVAWSVRYIQRHPARPLHALICKNRGISSNGFCIVVGDHPVAMGREIGDILALCRRKRDNFFDVVFLVVDNDNVRPGVFYDFNENEVS